MARWAVATILVFVSIGAWQSSGVVAQQVEVVQEPATSDTLGPGLTEVTSFGTFWQLTEKAGWLRWLIFGVFVVGMFLVFTKVIELLLEKRRARPLLLLDFDRMSLGEIQGVVRRDRENALSRLLSSLVHVFRSTGTAHGFNEEIGNYLRLEQERFNTFRMWMAFFSDTAGALGLLGTVWGIFTTFFGGTLDNQIILNGMAVALLTTLLGLIVSIALNLSATQVSSVFSRMLDQAASKADELRFRLMEMQGGNASGDVALASAAPSTVASGDTAPVTVGVGAAAPQPAMARRQEKAVQWHSQPAALEIRVSSVPSEEVPVGTTIKPAVAGRVVDREGNPRPGAKVRCAILAGDGYLAEGGRERVYTTDRQGRFEVVWTAGQKPGPQALRLALEGAAGKHVREVRFLAVPGPAENLRVLSGNHQGAAAGKALPKPLVVEVHDRFRNPVPGEIVRFSVRNGTGRFKEDRTEFAVRTDARGRAAAELILGKEPGLNEVVAAVGGGRLAVSFQLLGEA